MKNLKITTVFLIFMMAFGLTSCETEPVDPALVGGIPEDGNGGGNGGGISTGDYWPMAAGNQWVFIKDGVLQDPMEIIAPEQINGTTYYAYDTFFGNTTAGAAGQMDVWTRKEGGNYYIRQEANIPSVDGSPAITVSPIELIILKDNIAVNQTWTQNLTQTTTIEGFPPIVTTILINGEILEKDVAVTVNSIAYTNVIKAKVTQTTQGVVNVNYYWFAKDIGLIKYQNNYLDIESVSELSTYSLN